MDCARSAGVQLDARGAVPRIVLIGSVVVCLAAATIGYFLLASRKHGELGRYHFELESSLRELGNRQELYFARYERYASDACAEGGRCEVLGAEAAQGITLRTTGTENGWSAIATHSAIPDERCDIHVGDARSPGVSTEPARVMCTPFWP